jgi:hypothetical protein
VVVLGGTLADDALIPSAQVAYDPATNRWRTLPGGAGVAHGERLGQGTVWTGHQVLVWGGGRIDLAAQGAEFIAAPSGTAYDPAADTWVMLPKSPLQGRMEPVVVWTGTSLVVWGGAAYPGGSAVELKAVADGATYTP